MKLILQIPILLLILIITGIFFSTAFILILIGSSLNAPLLWLMTFIEGDCNGQNIISKEDT